MKMKILAVCIVIGLFVLACGCIEEKEEAVVETGNVEFLVTDKVTEDFDHVNVTFSEIRLFKQTDDDSYVTVMSEPKTVDLISLNLSHINETLGVVEIEVGDYSKLWINVSSAIGVLNETKETVNITVPSGWLKIQQLHLFNISKGNNTITVDIDLENSIHKYSGGEKYKFIPVISGIEHRHENKLQFREHNHSRIKNMVENRPPVIDVVTNGSRGKPITAVVDQNITFNASETFDIDGDSVTYYWDFDYDGTTFDTDATGPVVNHSYEEHGSYWVKLIASDEESESTEEIEIHVVVKKQGGGPS